MAVDKYLPHHVIRGLRNADVCCYLRCTSIDDDVQREAGIGVQLATRRDGIGIVEQVGRHTGYLIIEINGFYLIDRIVVAQAEGIGTGLVAINTHWEEGVLRYRVVDRLEGQLVRRCLHIYLRAILIIGRFWGDLKIGDPM